MLIRSRRERQTLACSLALSSTLVLLSGCGLGTVAGVDTAPSVSPAFKGTIFGGQQPISGTPIQIWTFGTSGYGTAGTLLASSSPTDANGGFQFAAGAYTCPQANAPVYLVGFGGNPGLAPGTNNSAIALGVPIGTCSNAPNVQVHINEVTTAAMAYSLAQFFTTTLGVGSGNSFGGPSKGTAPIVYSQGLLAAANNTLPNLVNAQYGVPQTSTATIIREDTKLNAIANVLASCINTSAPTSPACSNLFTYTTPPGGTAPSNTIQAAVQMALRPFQNVTNIYNLPSPTAPFTPSLSAAPHDWTLALAFKSTAFGLGVNNATTSNLDIDSAGNVWMPTTFPTPGVVEFSPSTSAFGTPVTVAGLGHPQNLAVDDKGFVWTTDFNSSLVAGFPATGAGGKKSLNLGANGYAITVGYADALYTAYQTAVPGTYGIGTINLARTTYTAGPALTFQPTGITSGEFTYDSLFVATNDGTNAYEEDVRISTATHNIGNTYTNVGPSSQIAISFQATGAPDDVLSIPNQNQFCSFTDGCFNPAVAAISSPQGVAVDGAGYIWIADANSASVSTTPGYSPTAGRAYNGAATGNALHNATYGNTMFTPYGVAIDNSGNVWVSNAGCVGTTTTPTCTPSKNFVLSEIVGSAAPTLTPVAAQWFGAALVGTRPTK